jgi:hypothetical protein
MNERDRNELLSKEYLQLQNMIDAFDTRTLTIKAWSVTFSVAAIGFAYREALPPLFLVASASAATFWLVDDLCKLHQRSFYPRVQEIEAHFAGKARTLPFQTGGSWRDTTLERLWKLPEEFAMLFLPSTALPHIVVVTAGLLLYFFSGLQLPDQQMATQHASIAVHHLKG